MNISSGDFFYHTEHGVGQVIRVSSEGTTPEVEIQFKDRPSVLFTEYLISRTCSRISPLGFRALTFIDPEKANQLLSENQVEVIRLVLIDSPGYKAKTEEIKEYLASYVNNWDPWWEKTQPALKEDPRIDTTNSRFRVYALAREVHSPAEEAYSSFKFEKQRSAQPSELVYRARAALALHQKGEILPQQHADELLDFLKQILHSEKYDIPLRLKVLCHLQQDKWITADEAQEWLEKLLCKDIRLYLLDSNTSRWLINEILRSPLSNHEIEILTGGICITNDAITRDLLLWIFHKGDGKIIVRFLIAALTMNLPPELEKEKYSFLKSRIDNCCKLVKCLLDSDPSWLEILPVFKQFNIILSSMPKLDEIRFLLPSLIGLGATLFNRVKTNLPEKTAILVESFASPTYPIGYIMAILDTVINNEKYIDLANEINNYLLENANLRQDDFLMPFISKMGENHLDQTFQIIRIIQSKKSMYLSEQGGKIICSFARQADEKELIDLLPYLDQLHQLQGEWSWRILLESLREKGYLAMFREPKMRKGYRDESLVNAAQQYSDLHVQVIHQEIIKQQDQLERIQKQVKQFQTLVEEKNTVLRELRGNLGGDTEEARFDERSRILKDFVTSIAEFERFITNQPEQSREIEAVIKRFSSILTVHKVMMTEPIGTLVDFNSQKHRVVDSSEVLPGEKVIILERGYLIRDHKENLRLLKPALVKKN